jgi:hypothetical protein
MIVENPNDYILQSFQLSETKGKKYDALLKHRETGKIKRVPFGALGYSQYADKTGLGHYSDMNHYDKKRRELYRLRHKGEDKNKFSSGYFSLKYLW